MNVILQQMDLVTSHQTHDCNTYPTNSQQDKLPQHQQIYSDFF